MRRILFPAPLVIASLALISGGTAKAELILQYNFNSLAVQTFVQGELNGITIPDVTGATGGQHDAISGTDGGGVGSPGGITDLSADHPLRNRVLFTGGAAPGGSNGSFIRAENTWAVGEQPSTITLAAWIKMDGDESFGWIASIDDHVAIATEEIGANQDFIAYTEVRGNTGKSKIRDNQPGQILLDDGQWHHMTLTYNFASRENPANVHKVYVDGQLRNLDILGDPGNFPHFNPAYDVQGIGPNFPGDLGGNFNIGSDPGEQPGSGFEGNDSIDGQDFLAWQRGESPDGSPTADDLGIWEANYGYTTQIPDYSQLGSEYTSFVSGQGFVTQLGQPATGDFYVGKMNPEHHRRAPLVEQPRNFKGWIDDVRLYDNVLTDAEILSLYLTTGGTPPLSASSSVPEPTSALLLAFAAMMSLGMRPRTKAMRKS